MAVKNIKNIKNLASAMLLKYSIMFLYLLGIASLMSGYIGIFIGTIILCGILIIFKIYYDFKFILGEIEEKWKW